MKCSWPGTCIKMFWPYLPREGSRAWPRGGGHRRATATNQIHSNDLEACVMKCCCFWFHFLVLFVTLESSLLQKCSLYSGERPVPLGALVDILKTDKILQIFRQFSRKFLQIFWGNRFTCMQNSFTLHLVEYGWSSCRTLSWLCSLWNLENDVFLSPDRMIRGNMVFILSVCCQL